MKSPDSRKHSRCSLFRVINLAAWVALLCSSCSKPQKSEEPSTSPTPSPAREKAHLETRPQESSAPATPPPTKAQLAEYASGLGIGPDAASRLLDQETKFVSALKNAVDSSPSDVPELLKPHLSALEMAFESTGKFRAQPDGTLPKWFFKAMSNFPGDPNSPGIRMNKAGYLGISEDRIFDQRAAFNGVAFIARTRAELLEGVVATRVNESPSPVDAMMYEAMLTGLADSTSFQRADSSGPDEDQPGSGAVRQMATGKNPVYRLIAAEQANRLNTADRLDFYESFIEEKDPQIKQRAIDGLAQIRSAETIEILRRFEQSSLQQGQKENADLAAQRIKQLENKEP